jgi:hypothetical protein
MELVEKMEEAERQVVLNYVRWFASEQRTLAGKAPHPVKKARPPIFRWSRHAPPKAVQL